MFIIKFIFSCVTPAELFCIVLLYDKLVHRVKYIISYNGASAWLFFLQRVVLLNLIVFRASCEHSAFCLYQSNNLMSWHKHGCDTINRIWFDAWSSLIKESFQNNYIVSLTSSAETSVQWLMGTRRLQMLQMHSTPSLVLQMWREKKWCSPLNPFGWHWMSRADHNLQSKPCAHVCFKRLFSTQNMLFHLAVTSCCSIIGGIPKWM